MLLSDPGGSKTRPEGHDQQHAMRLNLWSLTKSCFEAGGVWPDAHLLKYHQDLVDACERLDLPW